MATHPRPRHRGRRILLGVTALLVLAVGVVVILFEATGAHEVPLSTAEQRFRHDHGQNHTTAALHTPGRPPAGVYRYTATGSDSLSLPPKSIAEGPVLPGTVTYGTGKCWTLRFDDSSDHWQFTTYCPHGVQLLETSRGGWYRWDFGVASVADLATFTCHPAELAFPGYFRGARARFSCVGKNKGITLPRTTMSGSVQYLGTASVKVGHRMVKAVHVLESARFAGGQTGTDTENTWYGAANGLPLTGTWSTLVHSASPIGTSTLSSTLHFSLDSMVPSA